MRPRVTRPVALAAFVASLTAEQRQRLAALLSGKREGGDDA
jgi:hypothetical protein